MQSVSGCRFRRPVLTTLSKFSTSSSFYSASANHRESDGARKPNPRWAGGYGDNDGPSESDHRRKASSSYQNLVSFRRRHGLDELPSWKDKTQRPPRSEEYDQRPYPRGDGHASVSHTQRSGQIRLNLQLKDIHAEMKKNLGASRNNDGERVTSAQTQAESRRNQELWSAAYTIWEKSPKPIRRAERVLNQLMAITFTAGKHKTAMALLTKFKQLALTLPISTYTTVFTGLAQRNPEESSSMLSRARNLFSELEAMRKAAFDPNFDPTSQLAVTEEEEALEDIKNEMLGDEVYLPDQPSEEDELPVAAQEENSAPTKMLRQKTLQHGLGDLRVDREGLVGAYASYLRLLLVAGQQKEANKIFDRLADESFRFRDLEGGRRFVSKSNSKEEKRVRHEAENLEVKTREYTFLPPYPHIALFTIMFRSETLKVEKFMELLEMWVTVDRVLEDDIQSFSGAQESLQVLIDERTIIQFDQIALVRLLNYLGRKDIRHDLNDHLTLDHRRTICKMFENHFFGEKSDLTDLDSECKPEEAIDSIQTPSPYLDEDKNVQESSTRTRGFSSAPQAPHYAFPNSTRLLQMLHLFSSARRWDLSLKLVNKLDFSKSQASDAPTNTIRDGQKGSLSLILNHRHLQMIVNACAGLRDSRSALDWMTKAPQLNPDIIIDHATYAFAMKACSLDVTDGGKAVRNAAAIWSTWRNSNKPPPLDRDEIEEHPSSKDVKKMVRSYLVTLHRASFSEDISEITNISHQVPIEGEISEAGPQRIMNPSGLRDSTILATRQHLNSILEVYQITDGDGIKWLKNLQDSAHRPRAKIEDENLRLVCRLVKPLTDIAMMETQEELKKKQEQEELKPRIGKYEKGKDKYGRDRQLMKAGKQKHHFFILNQAARRILGARDK